MLLMVTTARTALGSPSAPADPDADPPVLSPPRPLEHTWTYEAAINAHPIQVPRGELRVPTIPPPSRRQKARHNRPDGNLDKGITIPRYGHYGPRRWHQEARRRHCGLRRRSHRCPRTRGYSRTDRPRGCPCPLIQMQIRQSRPADGTLLYAIVDMRTAP